MYQSPVVRHNRRSTSTPIIEGTVVLTGGNSHMALWIALLFISCGAIIALTVVERTKFTAKK